MSNSRLAYSVAAAAASLVSLPPGTVVAQGGGNVVGNSFVGLKPPPRY